VTNPGARTIVAEDESPVAEMVKLALRRQGWQVDVVTGSPRDKGLCEIVEEEGLYQLTKPFDPKELVAAVRGMK